jgi:hypothetical protein
MSLFDLPFEEPDSAQDKPEPEPEPFNSADGKPPDSSPVRRKPRAPERRVHTVSELTTRIRTLLEEELFELWVEG